MLKIIRLWAQSSIKTIKSILFFFFLSQNYTFIEIYNEGGDDDEKIKIV